MVRKYDNHSPKEKRERCIAVNRQHLAESLNGVVRRTLFTIRSESQESKGEAYALRGLLNLTSMVRDKLPVQLQADLRGIDFAVKFIEIEEDEAKAVFSILRPSLKVRRILGTKTFIVKVPLSDFIGR